MPSFEPITGAGDEPRWLFAYGTLGPAGAGAGAGVAGWQPDLVRGRLYDLGPFPILVGWEDPDAGWVEGHVRLVDRRELEDQLDLYEGVEDGLYRRVAVASASGRRVWVYVYPHPIPSGARGPFTRWSCHRPTRSDRQRGG